ncbi:MAG TPA: DUF3667 domain-containing protein [Xanthomonadaceae bacterium]|nr:DUF3667 domain-containing protein [Xanthomonadaceae bacterium]
MSDATTPDATPRPACQNCGTPLLGPHCYACGQPVHGLVRQFSSVVGDFLDSVLNIDSRIVHTLWPLFAKPGHLSLEYFAGRRVRYVSPVRLFVFLSIVTFFVARLVVPAGNGTFQINEDSGDRIARATTVAEVERVRDDALAKLAKARAEIPEVTGAKTGIDAGAAAIRRRAQQRIDALREAAAHGEPVPMPDDSSSIEFDGKPWDAKTHPVRIGWWPQFANDWLNGEIGRASSNVARMRKDPSLFKDAALGAIPSTLFVLVPVFALLLKVLYLFKRRLYMEHLIVALHSHAFLCLALLGVFLLTALGEAVPLLGRPAGLVEVALFAWMPVYLLLMQKRVYQQGWTMTLLKYGLLGFCYLILLSVGAVLTVLASLVWA